MPERYSSLTPNESASVAVNYVKDRASLDSVNEREQDIPAHWTYAVEGDFPGESCLVAHGLLDRVFDRRPISPKHWYQFERGYRSPEAEIVERIRTETNGEGVAGLINNISTLTNDRNPYFTTGDFWTNKTQARAFEAVLTTFGSNGWLVEPTRIYTDEKEVVGLAIPGVKKFDIPSTYRGFERTATNMITQNEKYITEGDYPRVTKFGNRVPACYMIADTVPIEDERIGDRNDDSPYQRLIALVKENTHPKPEYQNVLYVMGEVQKGDREIFIPRYVGAMTTLMLEYAYGTPVGVRISDYDYMVPQEDMDEEELENVDNSLANWALHKNRIIGGHPQVFPK